jgi:hypothetical protein
MCVVWRGRPRRGRSVVAADSFDCFIDERLGAFAESKKPLDAAAVAQRTRAKGSADQLALSIAGAARNSAPCADQ